MAKIGRHGRRMFLRGAGGFTLALPFLPSLVSDRVAAQVHQQKRFVGIGTGHGGVLAEQMFPADATATEEQTLFPGHVAHHGALPYSVDRGTAQISPVLSAPEAVLTPALASKMNVVRGLGITRYMGHHRGAQLGNFAYKDSGEGASLDQVLAWSDNFYPNLDAVSRRSIQVDTRGRGFSWGYANPRTRTGQLAMVSSSERSSLELFENLFGSAEPAEEPRAERRSVVDRVYEHYRAMSSGRFEDARQLSSEDRRRLSEHMDRMQELQRRLESRAAAASCGGVARPERVAGKGRDRVSLTSTPVDEAQNGEWFSLYNDVIAAAFICNASSVATIYAGTPMADGWSGSPSDWHGSVAHAGDRPRLAAHVTSIFRRVFLDLAAKLDVPEANGRTYLDNSLIQLTQEHGFLTHFALEMPLVTIGAAGDYFETGRFVDYRYRESLLLPKRHWVESGSMKGDFREGLTWNQYLANVAFAMGLGTEELEHSETPGFGAVVVNDIHRAAFHDGILNAASDPLPLLAKP